MPRAVQVLWTIGSLECVLVVDDDILMLQVVQGTRLRCSELCPSPADATRRAEALFNVFNDEGVSSA